MARFSASISRSRTIRPELDHQGPDSGSHTVSDIFYANGMQEKLRAPIWNSWRTPTPFDAPIVTRVTGSPVCSGRGHTPGLSDSQSDSPYIVVNDLPKIANLKALYSQYYKDTPAKLALGKS